MKSVVLLSLFMAAASSLLLAQANLKSAADQVNSETSNLEPQKIFDTPTARRLRSVIEADLRSHNGEATLELLRTENYDTPSWQVMAASIIQFFSINHSSAENLPMLKEIFAATVVERDHWLNYDSPRGWTNPYRFRDRVARLIISSQRSEPLVGEIQNRDLLRDDPMGWLESNDGSADIVLSSDTVATAKPTRSETTTSSAQKAKTTEIPETGPVSESAETEKSSLPMWMLFAIAVAALGILALLLRAFMRGHPS